MFLNPPLKPDPVNRTFLLGTIRTLPFRADNLHFSACSGPAQCIQSRGEQKANPNVENIMKISDTLLPEFDQEVKTTRKCLERIPNDKFTYKPHPKSFDMGSLAVHIATMLGWGVTTLGSDSFDYAPVGAEPYVPPVVKTNADLLALFDKASAEFRAALAATDNDT